MRKTLFFLSSSLFLSALFYSCKKDEANTTRLQSEITTQTAASRINNNVIDWLDNQKEMSKPKLKEHLELLMTNLEFSRAKTEEFNNVDDFIAIPLNKNYNRIKNIDERSRINLVVFAGKSGEIKGARIIELIPEPGNDFIATPDGVFKKAIYKQFPGVNGTFKLSGLSGHLYNQATYKNGRLFSWGIVQKGNGENVSSRMDPIEGECTDWYLYETWYDEDGNIIDWELTYLYTTCEDDEGGGGGGGGEDEFDLAAEAELMSKVYSTSSQPALKNISFSSVEPVEEQVQFIWVVVKNTFDLWKVTSTDIAKGYKLTNNVSVIYDIQHQGSAISGQTTYCRILTYPGPCITFINLSWQERSFSKSIAGDYKSGTSTVSGTLKNMGFDVDSYTQSGKVSVN